MDQKFRTMDGQVHVARMVSRKCRGNSGTFAGRFLETRCGVPATGNFTLDRVNCKDCEAAK